MIGKRGVYFIGGYEPNTPTAFFARLQRELGRFDTTWRVRTTVSPVTLSQDGAIASAQLKSAAMKGEWQVTAPFHFLPLDDLVRNDAKRPLLPRLADYLVAF